MTLTIDKIFDAIRKLAEMPPPDAPDLRCPTCGAAPEPYGYKGVQVACLNGSKVLPINIRVVTVDGHIPTPCLLDHLRTSLRVQAEGRQP